MKSRKLLGILLAMVLVISILPMTALANDDDEVIMIEELNFNVVAPEEGTVVTADFISEEEGYDWKSQSPRPDVTVADSDAHYYIYVNEGNESKYWVDDNDASKLYVNNEDDPCMLGGHEYTAYIRVDAEEGYGLPKDSDSISINVNGATYHIWVIRSVLGEDYAFAYDILLYVDVEEKETIKTVDLTITAPKCGTVVTADEYADGEPVVKGEPGKSYDWDSQNPYPEVTIPDDAPYELDDSETMLYGYWIEKEEYGLYVNWEENPCMVGGDTVVAEIWIRSKDEGGGFEPQPKSPFNEELEINVTGGTLLGYDYDNPGLICVYVEVEVEHIEGEPVTENVVDPLCLEDGSHENVVYCEACGAELSREPVVDDQLGHDWGEWKVVKEPQVGVAGEEQRICKRDPSHVETREIAPLEEEETEKPTEKETEKEDNPQTNDENNMWMWIAFMGVAAFGIVGSAVYDRKRKKD
ncbi:MAG: hypothetical protein IJM53_03715 [Lachnospiraceae bacterium]|nr:hypothetical protein [Lachnospiraceae bacterium]